MNLRDTYFATHTAITRWRRIERQLAAWLQGWTIIVVLTFAAKIIWPVPWRAVASIAGGETVLVLLVLAAAWYRQYLTDRLRSAEARIAAGDA